MKKESRFFTGKRIILTRQHCVDLGEEETELRKYQPVDGLMTGIFKKAFRRRSFRDRVRITEMEESLEYIHRFTDWKDNVFTETWESTGTVRGRAVSESGNLCRHGGIFPGSGCS